MRKLILLLFIVSCLFSITAQQFQRPCYLTTDLTNDYQSSVYDFSIDLFKLIAVRGNFNYVFSPMSIWIILSAVAEGTEPVTQQKLFKLLNLPNDPCIRQIYYQLATSRAFPYSDVNIKSTRALLIDESLRLNPVWHNYVVKNSLLDVITAPMRYNPVVTANEIRRIMSAQLSRLDLSGNSVLLDTMDYSGLWTTAFTNAKIERAPFYNQTGQAIGTVDLMRVKRKAKLGYIDKIGAKLLELPVGINGRYRMMFLLRVDNNLAPAVAAADISLVFEVFESLRVSEMLVDIAIPRLGITSEIDVRSILEDIGVTDIWTDPAATRYISTPAAFPSSFVHRATMFLNNEGLLPPSQDQDPVSTRTGVNPALGRTFIADRPFLLGLVDVETSTWMLTSAYTVPTYPY